MKFQSQRIAWFFFATCMLLFSLQIVYGFLMAFAHAGYDVLHPLIPFNAMRATHTNLLVVWLLAGFMGALASQFWFLAFAIDTAARVRTLALIEMIFAQVVTKKIFQQKTSAREIAGMAIMIAGVVILMWT